jgi:mutator protein MutT
MNTEENMNNITICAAVIFNNEGEVLLQLRDDLPNLRSPGYWTLPGGHKEYGETQVECVIREVYEETNLKIQNPDYLLTLKDFFESKPFPIVHFYLKTINQPYEIICNEGKDLKFWKLSDISNLKTNMYLSLVLDFSLLFKLRMKNFTS